MFKEPSDLTDAEQKAHREAFGGYNDFPPNWKEIDETEVTSGRCHIRVYRPELIEYRQMGKLMAGAKPLLDCRLYFFHDGYGYAVHYDYWKKKIRHFTFARCLHEYKQISRPAGNRSGESRYQCTKCGYINSVDTSD